jgi:predicted nucleic acid-binding protein
MAAYIVDNSVWWKAGRHAEIADRLRQVATQHLILTCPPQVLEYCFSAEDPDHYEALRADMELFHSAEHHPEAAEVLVLQQMLWDGGRKRAAGALDTLIAAYAIANDAIVLTADRDFLHLAAVESDLRVEYVRAA